MPARKRVHRDWPAVIADQIRSGLSVSAYCQQHQINCGLFYRHRLACRATTPSPSPFIQLGSAALPTSGAGVTLITPAGWRIELEPGFDVSTLERVCACLPSPSAC